MLAIVVGAIVMTLHSLVGWLLPGMYLESRFAAARSGDESLAGRVVRALALGSVSLTLQFFVAKFAAVTLGVPWPALFAAKLLMDATLIALWFRRHSDQVREIRSQLNHAIRDPSVWALTGGAVAYGALATCLCPFALDNAALVWLNQLFDGSGSDFATSQGSPAYIALLYFPFLMTASWMPLPTLTAGLKVVLCLLGALTARRISSQLPLRSPRLSSVVLFAIVLSSFMAQYGFLQTAKESAFAVLFLMLYMAELLRSDRDQTAWGWSTGLVLAAAFGFGAITVPYAAILTASFVVLAWSQLRFFDLTFKLAAATAVPLVPTLHAMLKVPLWQAAGVAGAVIVASFALRRWNSPLTMPRLRPHIVSRIALGLTVALLFGIYALLPLEYVVSRDPIDGKTGFGDLLIRCLPEHAIHVGLVGLAVTFFLRDFRTNRGLLAFAIFPFAVLFPTLLCAKWNVAVPFHPQHLWDLVKDIPNWCYGIYYGTFALVALDAASRLILSSQRLWHVSDRPVYRAWTFAPLAIVLCVSANDARKDLKQTATRHDVYYTRIGGFRNQEMGQLLNALTDERQRRPSGIAPIQLALAQEAAASETWRHVFPMYGIYPQPDFDGTKPFGTQKLSAGPPCYLLARERELPRLMNVNFGQVSFQQLGRFGEFGELYRIVPRAVQIGSTSDRASQN